MRNGIHRLLVVALILSAGSLGLSAWAAETSDVLSPAKRAEVLTRAKHMLAARETPAITIDPFHSVAFAEASGAIVRPVPAAGGTRSPSARTPQDLLQAIAANLKPSGNFVINGERTLIFGQKRVKAGGAMTITFEGTEYSVEITAIEANNFTLRLNREGFTRPIK
jgi:hypothetical protein